MHLFHAAILNLGRKVFVEEDIFHVKPKRFFSVLHSVSVSCCIFMVLVEVNGERERLRDYSVLSLERCTKMLLHSYEYRCF